LAAMITARHPRAAMLARLQSGNYEAWAREGFEMTKASAYPASLKRGELSLSSNVCEFRMLMTSLCRLRFATGQCGTPRIRRIG